MWDKRLIKLTDLSGNFTMVLLDDGIVTDTWDHGVLGPARFIESGSGHWDHLGVARVVNLYDGASGRKVVQLRGVARYPFKLADSGEGLLQGKSPALAGSVIQWEVLN